MITASDSQPFPIDICVGASGVDFLPRSAWQLKKFQIKVRMLLKTRAKSFILLSMPLCPENQAVNGNTFCGRGVKAKCYEKDISWAGG